MRTYPRASWPNGSSVNGACPYTHGVSNARLRAKKTPCSGSLGPLPPRAATTYEALREQVLAGGGSPSGLAIMLTHGFVRGLCMIGAPVKEDAVTRALSSDRVPTMPLDPALLRLLANMVLHVRSEGNHAY